MDEIHDIIYFKFIDLDKQYITNLFEILEIKSKNNENIEEYHSFNLDTFKSLYGEKSYNYYLKYKLNISHYGILYDFKVIDNVFEGNGIIIFGDGFIYDGMMKNGFPHDYGKMIYKDYYYLGEWKYGEKDGLGTIYYINGDTLSCKWEKNKQNGSGKLTENKIIYNVTYKEGRLTDKVFYSGSEVISNIIYDKPPSLNNRRPLSEDIQTESDYDSSEENNISISVKRTKYENNLSSTSEYESDSFDTYEENDNEKKNKILNSIIDKQEKKLSDLEVKNELLLCEITKYKKNIEEKNETIEKKK